MGSLLPGWDERIPGVPPKEMEDYEDGEERMGYFARLEKAKTMRHAAEAAELPEGLGRTLQHSATTLERRSTERPGALRSVLSRQASLPADWRLDEPTSPHAVPVSPLSPITPTSPTSPSAALLRPAGSLDTYRTAPRRKAGYSWWDKMGSSALNEKPDEEAQDDGKGYVPQFEVAGGLHYRVDASPAAAAAAAPGEAAATVHAAA